MQGFHSRSGVADDTEAIFEVMVRAFNVEENSDRWHSWHKLAVRDAERFRVLEVEGKVVGVAIINPER